ncbi:putative thiosulfate sulfurtransferase, mitochondrial [Folsomia candida]|uniref:Putative thiosulfate sulfurtransferase, mitochondrial n=1 Tax=Folsomia candida TaxID=158441 RepID=A0A226DLY6_FOLCA|nr:putative thiosulfate sulfurtransferase, mitochondrial [Folsomia candida]OXA46018.1 putative thiosulfate sulfurtransferase, mitochondrial [Folsomia candida]
MSGDGEESGETSGPIIQDIEFEDLKKGLIDDGTLKLVDVRDPQELETQGKIPKSINIPLPEIPDAFRNLSNEEFSSKYGFSKNDDNLVFSCRSGRRAEAAINHVFGGDPSISKFRLYRGSFMDWEAKGGPIEKP